MEDDSELLNGSVQSSVATFSSLFLQFACQSCPVGGAHSQVPAAGTVKHESLEGIFMHRQTCSLRPGCLAPPLSRIIMSFYSLPLIIQHSPPPPCPATLPCPRCRSHSQPPAPHAPESILGAEKEQPSSGAQVADLFSHDKTVP